MSAIIDFLLNQQLLKQQQAQNQNAIQSMFGGTPPSSINVTPQMQMPMQMTQAGQSPLLIPPQGEQPSPNLAAAQQADPGVAAALQNQLQTNQQSGAYDVNRQPGAVAPAYSGPNASGMQDFFSKLPTQSASLLLDTMGKQQIDQTDPEYQARLKTLQNANSLQDQQTQFFKNALGGQPQITDPNAPPQSANIGGVPLEDLRTAFQSGGAPAAQKLIADAATKKIDAAAKKNSNPLITGAAAIALGLDPKYNWQQGVDGVYKPVEPPKADTQGLSPIAKLVSDHKNGLIDDATFKAAVAKETHVSEPSDNAGWQVANDPTTNTPFRLNVRTGEAKDLKGNTYTPGGFQKPQSGQARSAMAMGVQKFMQENPDATSDDIAHYAADYNKTITQVGGEAKADAASLRKVTGLYDVASSQEAALAKSIDLAKSLMNKGAGTQYGPIVNRWTQGIKSDVGDPDVAKFASAMDTATNLYGMLMTGSNGTTDASRKEAKEIADKLQSPEAILGQFDVMTKDGHFKTQSYLDHKGFIQSRLQPSAPTDEPWTTLPNGIRIREKK